MKMCVHVKADLFSRNLPTGFKPLFKKLFPYIGLLVLLDTAGIIYFFPQIQTIYSILSAPSASESLLSPSTSSLTNSIAQHIRTHPIAQALRADGSYTESRPHLRLPQPMRQHSLTAGVLAGPGRIVVPPLVFCDDLRGKLVSLAFLGEDLCGHPGIIHGGLSATLLDESMGRCGLAALPNRMGFTAQLTVNYRKPVKAGSYVVIKAEVVKTEGRKVWVTGRIEGLEDGEMEGEVLAEAEALFVQPRNTPVLY